MDDCTSYYIFIDSSTTIVTLLGKYVDGKMMFNSKLYCKGGMLLEFKNLDILLSYMLNEKPDVVNGYGKKIMPASAMISLIKVLVKFNRVDWI